MNPPNEPGARAYRDLLGEGPSDRSLMVQRASIVWNLRQKNTERKRQSFYFAAWGAPLLLLVAAWLGRHAWPQASRVEIRADEERRVLSPVPPQDSAQEAAASLPSDASWQELYRAGFERKAYQLITETGVETVLLRGTESDLELLAELAQDLGNLTLERRCQMARRFRFRPAAR